MSVLTLHLRLKTLTILFLVIGYSTGLRAQGLPGDISRLISQLGLSQDSVSLVIREVESGRNVLSVNPAVPRHPASVIKLVTTIAAMELLGPTWQWETRYLGTGPVNHDGRLQGNLVMQGGGDPFLTLEQFWLHVLALRQQGISHIDGNLIIDNTRFDTPPHDRAAFDNQPLRLYNVGPDAALTNFSATRFVIEPQGEQIHVFSDPPLAGLTVRNQLTAAPGQCLSRNQGWSMHITREESRLQAHFRGQYRTRCGRHSVSRSYFSSPEYTYRLFRYLWESMGGTLTGGYRTGSTPPTAQLLTHMKSRSLAENVAAINKYSNNVMARLLLLTIGNESTSKPHEDTLQAGRQAVTQWLDRIGIPTRDLVIENGAGLSRHTRVTASQIADLLSYAWHSNWQPEILASLSLLAMDGTMRSRLKQSGLDGRARIKTGLLRGVRSMAGYVHADNGQHYTVTLFIHSPKVRFWNGNRIQNAVLKWVHRRP